MQNEVPISLRHHLLEFLETMLVAESFSYRYSLLLKQLGHFVLRKIACTLSPSRLASTYGTGQAIVGECTDPNPIVIVIYHYHPQLVPTLSRNVPYNIMFWQGYI